VKAMAMTQRQALEVLAQHRGERIVIATMASIAFWPQLSDRPLDFAYMPSAMGQGPALGLGLALAHPERGSIVLSCNRGFADWALIFNEPVVATAIVDRLLHRATVINIRGHSYRMRGYHADQTDDRLIGYGISSNGKGGGATVR